MRVANYIITFIGESRLILEALIAFMLVWIRLDQIVRKRLHFDKRQRDVVRRVAAPANPSWPSLEQRRELNSAKMLAGMLRRYASALVKAFVR